MILKYKSKIGKADTKGRSSRIIIPRGIIDLLEAKWGDELVWTADISKEGVKITVEKAISHK